MITPSHIVSAFDLMDWTKPEDIPQTFRSIASDKEWFQNAGRNQWEAGQRGLNHLDRLRRGDGNA